MKFMLAAALAFGIAAPLAAQPRLVGPIAYVSVQRILNEANHAKEAAKELEELRRAKSEDVAEKQKALEAARLELANSGGWFRASRRAQAEEQVTRHQAELQTATEQAQTDLQQRQRDLQEELRNELVKQVQEVAKRRGIQTVLNADTSLVWTSAGIDLTGEVLERLNAAEKQEPEKPEK